MNIKPFLLVAIVTVFLGCKNEPKVIKSNNESNNKASGVFSGSGNSESNNTMASNEFHKVLVNEVLPTSKYIYLNVTEETEKFWVATGLMEVKVGETYYYKGGLLKTNFESKEYNRVFDKVYLVTNLVAAANHGKEGATTNNTLDYTVTNVSTTKQDIEMHTEKVVHRTGSIKIADLVKYPKKYEGQTIQLDGICTKVNAGIMNRNWVHIKDGSKDDFDLVITSDAYVPEGSAFTIKAVVVLNKDFGAGYKYDLILEHGEIIK